jgi:tetratricopeptide (TPR) repeat protein
LTYIEEAATRARSAKSIGPRDAFGIEYERVRVSVLAGKYVGAASTLVELTARCDALLGDRNEDCQLLPVLRSIVLLRADERRAALELIPRLLEEGRNELSPRRALASQQAALRILAANGQLSSRADVRERVASAAESDSQALDDRSMAFSAIAESYLHEDKAVDAERWARRAASVQAPSSRPSLTSRARAQMMLGIALQRQSRGDEALTVLKESQAMYRKAIGDSHPLLSLYALNEAVALIQSNRREEALPIIDAAVPVLESAFGGSSPVVRRAKDLRAAAVAPLPGGMPRSSMTDFFC